MIVRIKKRGKNNIFVKLAYICAFSIIYMSGSVNQIVNSTGSILDNILKYISLVISLLFTIIAICYSKKFAKNIFAMIICVFLLGVLFIANYAATAVSLIYFLIRFISFIGLFAGMEKMCIDFLQIMYKTFLVIAVATLICYLMINILGIEFPYKIISLSDVSWYTDNYYVYFGGLYQYRPVASYIVGAIPIIRLSGFAWEPGVYGIFISIALFYHMFIYDNPKRIELIVLMISALLTFSTTCLGIVTLLIFLYFTDKDRNVHNKSIYHKYTIFIIMAPLVLAIIGSIFIEKFSIASGTIRVSDFLIGLKIFLSNPILGIGYNNTDVFLNLQGLGRGNTNGLMSWIYYMGLVGTIVLAMPFIINLKHENRKKKYLYLIVLICCNAAEPIIEFPFMSLLIAYEYYKIWNN